MKIAAWNYKSSYGVIATDDLELDPALAHWMYERSGTKVTEIKGSHIVYVSQPRAVARVIETAPRALIDHGAPAGNQYYEDAYVPAVLAGYGPAVEMWT